MKNFSHAVTAKHVNHRITVFVRIFFYYRTDIAEMLGMKTMARGIRLTPMKDGAVKIECDVVAKFGQSVFSLAKTVQDAVKSSVESVAGLTVAQVNVNICGIAMPKELKK